MTELKIENCGRVFFLWRLVISMTDQFFRTHPSLTAYSSRSKPHTPNKLHIFGKLWTWAFAWSYPGFFFFEQISRNERFMKKLVFLHFFVSAPKKIQVAADRTILTPAAFPIAHLKAYAPRISGNMWKMSVLLKLGVPAPSKVTWSRFVSPPKSCF